jgi:hypothetical protein
MAERVYVYVFQIDGFYVEVYPQVSRLDWQVWISNPSLGGELFVGSLEYLQKPTKARLQADSKRMLSQWLIHINTALKEYKLVGLADPVS